MKDQYYWDERRRRYVLHAFDELFKKGDGALRFHHYKASIVVNDSGTGVWLYEASDFDRLIALIKRAKRACLNAPALRATDRDAALEELHAKRRAARRRRRNTRGR